MTEKDSYVKMRMYCKCACPAHCEHSCLECDSCTDCECPRCLDLADQNKGTD